MRREHTIDLRDQGLARNIPRGRALHLVDLENLVGGASATSADVADALASYERVVRFGPGDHRVIACAKRLWPAARMTWPGALVRAVKGIDAADHALLVEADVRYVIRHYDRVVVASGDHIFAPRIVELDRNGVDVCVVSKRWALSRAVGAVAPVVWYLDEGWSSIALPA